MFYGHAADDKFESLFKTPEGIQTYTYANKQIVAGSKIKCSSDEFGDVAYGKLKSCFCAEPEKEPYKLDKDFVAEKCADQGGQCNCTSTIHFGKLGEDFTDMMALPHKTKKVEGKDRSAGFMMCSPDVFGDPIPGSKK